MTNPGSPKTSRSLSVSLLGLQPLHTDAPAPPCAPMPTPLVPSGDPTKLGASPPALELTARGALWYSTVYLVGAWLRG